jgi:hypothetical protein
MKITHSAPSPEATRTLEALRKAVQQKLEEKRRLGHYYVVWQDERAVFIGPDAPADDDPRAPDAPGRCGPMSAR